MPLVKVGPKHQVTIPKEVFRALQLEVGDIVEMQAQNGRGVMIPKRLLERAPAPRLTKKQQQLLSSARRKIRAIQENLRKAKGLTGAESAVAAKVGLIDPEQRWWWTEEWQRGERHAQRDIEEGRVSKSYGNLEEALKALKADV